MSILKINQITDSSGTKNLIKYDSVTGSVSIGDSSVTGNLAINVQDVTLPNNLVVVTQATTSLLKISNSLAYNRDIPRVTLDLGDSTDAILIPSGTDQQRPTSPVVGMLRYSTSSNKYEVYTSDGWKTLATAVVQNGLTPDAAAASAQAIKLTTGTTTNGLYYINVPSLGTRQLWCNMSGTYGWMFMMRGFGNDGLAYADGRWTDSSDYSRTDLHTGNYGGWAKDAAFYYFTGMQYIRLDAGGFSGANADGSYRTFDFYFDTTNTPTNLMFTTSNRMNWGNIGSNSRAAWRSTFGHDRDGTPVFERYGSTSNHSIGNEGRGRRGCGQPMMFGYQASDSESASTNDVNSGLGTHPSYCGGNPGGFSRGSWMGNGGYVNIYAR